MELTASQIRYLLAVYKRNKIGVVRSADIAEDLAVTRPSVHRMIIQLSKMSLLEKEKYSSIRITQSGWILAEQFYDSFSYISAFLHKNMNLPLDSAEEGSFAILSRLSMKEMGSIFR